MEDDIVEQPKLQFITLISGILSNDVVKPFESSV